MPESTKTTNLPARLNFVIKGNWDEYQVINVEVTDMMIADTRMKQPWPLIEVNQNNYAT